MSRDEPQPRDCVEGPQDPVGRTVDGGRKPDVASGVDGDGQTAVGRGPEYRKALGTVDVCLLKLGMELESWKTFSAIP